MFLKIFHWIWGLPQNLLGLILSFFSNSSDEVITNDGTICKVHFSKLMNSGISLGNYIILDSIYKMVSSASSEDLLKTAVSHEHGHQIQSLILGPLYLLVVGLVSIVRNIWDRLFHKSWYLTKRLKWYYSGYPENWADKLGKVTRNFD